MRVELLLKRIGRHLLNKYNAVKWKKLADNEKLMEYVKSDPAICVQSSKHLKLFEKKKCVKINNLGTETGYCIRTNKVKIMKEIQISCRK